ncbi:glycosyltransferase [Phyllobacterium meliloti]|uniref:glycosyltransferase n=1 Tax=Phyllobacterium meliloti TaxID=555317 RepID=UPI001D14CD51|nr:glycosyltransferase [Phyllobacterium sp. T1293]UGX87574.1 glycosyltransferase [Phyllobacterium sp. T1293]
MNDHLLSKSDKKAEEAKIRALRASLLASRKSETQLRQDLDQIHNSVSWKVTRPLREMNAFAQRRGVPVRALRFAIRQFRTSVSMFGLTKTIFKSINFLRDGKLTALAGRHSNILHSVVGNGVTPTDVTLTNPDKLAPSFMVTRVLLVAEMSIPQCKKYRVLQKAELLSKIGIESTIVDWTHFEEVRTKLQTHPIVIFYRVPAFPDVISLVEEAKRLGVYSFWEVDDLIFDIDSYLANKNLDSLEPGLKESVLAGVPLYREALTLCDAGIGSTRTIADMMAKTTGKSVHVIENAIDTDTLKVARRIRRSIRASADNAANQYVTIVYGSGSKAHDADFMEASAAIYNILQKRENVRLWIAGELNIDASFGEFADRVQRFPSTTFDTYLETIAKADISIAPLEPTVFNDAKSNIKFLEASILGLPSVCSPRETFQAAISDGNNGFLASTATQWEEKLLALIDNPDLRKKMAKGAHKSACRNYSLGKIAKREVASIIQSLTKRPENKTRILIANVYFAPQSFGGATIVAEDIAQKLSKKENVEVYVFASWPNDGAPDYGLIRYDAKGSTVFAVKVPTIRTRYMDIDDGGISQVFAEVLKTVRPDVVHLHSIQTLGVSLTSACSTAGIPYAITLHDAWWLCERQFMVTGENRYCFQTTIDPAVCAKCVPDKLFNEYRTDVLKPTLLESPNLISPSAYFKNLHMQNGVSADQIFVNKNGINPPSPTYKRTRSKRLRFGYVGGISAIKGYDLIKKAFAELPACEAELVIVDNTLNLGYSSMHADEMKTHNTVRIVPAYSHADIDDFFSEIDVLLFPTQWKESFGLTVREALIRDVWVIASDAGAVVEDIVPEENGYIIPISRDSNHLKMAMQRCIERRDFLTNYVNPYKDRIQTSQAQADELYDYLVGLVQN